MKRIARSFFVAVVLLVLTATPCHAFQGTAVEPEITPYDLINAMNSARMGNGLPALTVSDILMGTAQATAEIMAANRSGGHIGDVKGRVMAAGYGGGQDAWATENIMTGPVSLDGIMMAWSDDLHMIPALNPNYCHIGAGIAENDGVVYYVLHAAYTSMNACGGGVTNTTNTTNTALTPVSVATSSISQWIIPVQIATPGEDGYLVHIVKSGQTLWTIAEAYGVTIEDIMNMNYYISPENQEIYIGQKVYLPTLPVTITPTPEEELTTSTPLPVKKSTATREPVLTAAVTQAPTSQIRTEQEEDPPALPLGKLDKTIQIGILAAICLGGVLVVWGLFFNRS